jgi:single-strand DNA-binding protein
MANRQSNKPMEDTMTGTNRVFLLGYLGSAPQTRIAKTGGNYTSLSIATHRYLGTDENGKKTATDWHYVRVWGKQGESCAKYLTKGQFVHIEGYLTQYAQERDGKIERHTGINALQVDFLPRANREVFEPRTSEAPEPFAIKAEDLSTGDSVETLQSSDGVNH